VIALEGAGYRYPSAGAPSVRGVDLRVDPGEIVLLCGPTGCGKSTLLRLAAGLLQRHGAGERWGRVTIGGLAPERAAPSQRVRALGFVSQEPDDQLVAGTVGDELAFGMESAGFSPERIEARLPALLAAVGLAVDLERDTAALSGGQTQRLTTAAALAAGARALVLDEPLAQLDPAGARALMGRLRALADEGVAVLLVEHRLESCLPFVDRVAAMADGALALDAPVAEVAPGSAALGLLRRLGLTLPGLLDLEDRLGRDPRGVVFRRPEAAPPEPEGAAVARLDGARWRYPGAAEDALGPTSLTLRAGERVALVGPNGAGKSTLLKLLAGELEGPRTVAGRLVAVPQDPDLSLFCATVRQELAYGPEEAGLTGAALAARVGGAAAALSVEDLLERAPQALSRGQRLRVAAAAALSCAPAVLLLDEPTSGQDHAQVERMMAALRAAMAGGALVFATHDLDLALRHATRVVTLRGGAVAADGPPGEALSGAPAGELPLPGLARLCRERGLPPLDAEALAALADPAEGAG
jgi:energy-coupling factor transporter ATP-binding protein EcfA2